MHRKTAVPAVHGAEMLSLNNTLDYADSSRFTLPPPWGSGAVEPLSRPMHRKTAVSAVHGAEMVSINNTLAYLCRYFKIEIPPLDFACIRVN